MRTRPRFRRIARIGAAVALGVLSTACTRTLIRPEAQAFSARYAATSAEGFAVSVHPVGASDSKKYFGRNLLSESILPIFVVGRTTGESSSSSFLLSPAVFSLLPVGDGTPVSAQEPSAGDGGAPALGRVFSSAGAGSEVAFAGSVGAALGSSVGKAIGAIGPLSPTLAPAPVLALAAIPLTLAGSKLVSDASERRRAVVLENLYTATVSPGEIVHGFVYFRVPDAVATRYVVRVQPRNLTTGQTVMLDVPIEVAGQ